MDSREEFNEIKKNSFSNRPAKGKNENDDEILIRLYRQYSKDEVVSASQRRLSEARVELGKWKAYSEELEDTILKMKVSKAKFENLITEGTNKRVKEFRRELKEIKRENLELKDYVKTLLNKLGG